MTTILTTTRPAPPRGSEFAPLLREIKRLGLLERRTGHYAAAMIVNLVLLAAVWAAVIAVGNSWWVLVLAVPMAVLSARTCFFGHDAGHQQIASSRKVHDLLGLFHGNLLLGMSYGWWNDKHNRHHANPNHTGKDPDVAAGVLVWTLDQARGRAGAGRGWWYGWLTRHQAKLFFPLLLLEGFNLKVSAIRDLHNRPGAERTLEAWLIVIHHVVYVSVLFTVLPAHLAVLFILVHQMLFGLHLGSVFAPNHKGMEMPAETDDWGHLDKQVRTSRNVTGGPVTDWLMGGLNYQIEHHLFPNMPRPNLRRAQPVVQAYCERIGLPYVTSGVMGSYAAGLRHLDQVGSELRDTTER
jgi:fatty acid desaturase